jgi:hypothetical protein
VALRLFDDDVSATAVVRGLRSRDIDLVTSLEAGMFGKPDPEHLAFATSVGRVCCSGNRRDYARLHSEYMTSGKHHAGIILITQQKWGAGEQVRRLMALVGALDDVAMIDSLEYLSRWAR